MGSRPQLNCYFFPDLFSWEREAIEPITAALSEHFQVNQIEVGEGHRGALRKRGEPAVHWLFSSNWLKAARFLGARPGCGPVWASVLGLPSERGPLFTLLWRKRPREYNAVRLITHSPLNMRFYRELVGLPEEKVILLPLPFSPRQEREFSSLMKSRKEVIVGTFATFNSESNLNYFVSVAHYVASRRPNVRFKILGSGLLYPHIERMVEQMGLTSSISVEQTHTAQSVLDLDLLLYVPLRNDHFIPLLVAAAAGISVVCSELPGIEEFVQDGKSGFVVPCNETKPMGELAIRLVDHEALRRSMAGQLKQHISHRFEQASLVTQYQKTLLSQF